MVFLLKIQLSLNQFFLILSGKREKKNENCII